MFETIWFGFLAESVVGGARRESVGGGNLLIGDTGAFMGILLKGVSEISIRFNLDFIGVFYFRNIVMVKLRSNRISFFAIRFR